MSLINDALKQAKQNQQSTPATPPPLEFKPVEAGQQRSRQSGLLIAGLSIVLIAIVGLTTTLAWFISQKNSPAVIVQAAANRKPITQTNTPVSKPVLVSDDSPAAGAPEMDSPTAAKSELLVPESIRTVAETIKPAPLKLQGIFFNANNPSAVVNGRSVNLGERVGAFFVLGISPSTVTLANGSQTNVLSLSE